MTVLLCLFAAMAYGAGQSILAVVLLVAGLIGPALASEIEEEQ